MNKICVFCGSSSGKNPIYQEKSRQLGDLFVKRNIEMIYGGGSIGLMGIIADTIMEKGGRVTGVIPQFLYQKEVGHDDISNLIIVNTMHERKHQMAAMSNGFIAMPGGIGTLEELFEIFTWSQLQLVRHPLGLLNVNGYYDPLLNMLQHMYEEGFLNERTMSLLTHDADPEALLDKMAKQKLKESNKGIEKI
ncbi:MAG TPA: TIGR00730 family Rossman fold protein [Cytophagales bacterium]|jgi:uncharacterized protein (TIGR00730 family)|nr:TIGR00730 family Rossman fold protein [Cytophagales bacterium]